MSEEFTAKTKEELSAMDIPELVTYVASLTADVEHKDDEHKQAILKAEEEKKEEEAKQAKKAEEEKEEAVRQAMDDEHKKDAARMEAVLKAMDEKDPEKRKEAIKNAMKESEEEKNNDANKARKADHEKEEENKALKAEVSYLASQINLPKIDYLKKVYEASNTDAAKIREYVAEWEKMDTKQLDGAIDKVKPLVETLNSTNGNNYEANASQQQQQPLGFSSLQSPMKTESFSASREFKKIDAMTPEQAFSQQGGGSY